MAISSKIYKKNKFKLKSNEIHTESHIYKKKIKSKLKSNKIYTKNYYYKKEISPSPIKSKLKVISTRKDKFQVKVQGNSSQKSSL